MKRFVFVSFLILGWLFYELSGGADFQPRGVRPVEITAEKLPGPANSTTERASLAAPAIETSPVPAQILVAQPAISEPESPRPSVSLNTPDDPVLAAIAEAQEDVPETAETASYNLEQVRAGLGQNLFGNGTAGDQSLTLASLEQGVSGLQEVTVPDVESEPANVESDAAATVSPSWVEPETDIREITGTRVNMRDGPGTIYPVISRLRIGQEVEVVGESGTGWLRLRSLPNLQIGWVSASLVSKPGQ